LLYSGGNLIAATMFFFFLFITLLKLAKDARFY